jgi:hypothetical protein
MIRCHVELLPYLDSPSLASTSARVGTITVYVKYLRKGSDWRSRIFIYIVVSGPEFPKTGGKYSVTVEGKTLSIVLVSLKLIGK